MRTSPPTNHRLPVVPLRGGTLFPGATLAAVVGRSRTVASLEAAVRLEAEEPRVLVVAQRDPSVEEPAPADLFPTGTIAVIEALQASPEGVHQVRLRGLERALVVELETVVGESEGDRPALWATIQPSALAADDSPATEAMGRELRDLARELLAQDTARATAELVQWAFRSGPALPAIYALAVLLELGIEDEQVILGASSLEELLRELLPRVRRELDVRKLRQEIRDRTKEEIDQEQRQHILRHQLREIQKELGEGPDEVAQGLAEKLAALELPEKLRREVDRELARLESIPPASPEHQVVRSWLEVVADLPWGKYERDRKIDVQAARVVLDTDHFGLEKVKERILEHLSVLANRPEVRAPILCLVGPPGVGKTSLGVSIAHALGREFERLSLGGLHDEAELRGHRRTYIGSMPGRLLGALRRAGALDPVIMLDEIDKLGHGFRGDPAAALLEILDPEQNKEFRDNYLDHPFDLSRVFFIATANTLDSLPAPLLDRLEIIRLSGYSEEEKLEIAKRYLVPKQLRESGVDAKSAGESGGDAWIFEDDAIKRLISRYTREAGVRTLEKRIAKVVRRIIFERADGRRAPGPVRIRASDLGDLLGPERFSPERRREKVPPGVAQGLAWTPTGGEILYVEAVMLPAGTGLTLTGQLGEVMRESAQAARSFVWSQAEHLGIDPGVFSTSGVHIHVPAGAIPKDGPSAGITLVATLASLYTGRCVRRDTAMTGEVTLSGLVLPVGGIKEKVLAAHRAGIERIVLPGDNRKDLHDLPAEVVAATEFVFVETVDEVLDAVLTPPAEMPCGTARV